MRILVSGASSGLGRFLKESLGADAYDRTQNHAPQKEYDVIIHSAFNVANKVPSDQFAQYLDDNIGLTSRLLSIPHKQFIFISSVDVYPKGGKIYAEDTPYNAAEISSLYGIMKLQAETLVQQQAQKPVILRCSSLLGKYMRPNSITRILAGENPSLSVAADSEYNFVLYDDVLALANHCMQQNISGIFNTTAAGNARIADITKHFGQAATFGAFRYLAGQTDNTKTAAIIPLFHNSSLHQLERFMSSNASSRESLGKTV
jgi:nucleoside-diphosphate-sugar epimerase